MSASTELSRRGMLATLAAAAVASTAAPGFGARPMQKRPNLVLIMTDDQGYGDLGSFGHPTLKTPHLDQMAADGMRLTSCYCPSPVCSPARAGVLTGRHPLRCGIDNWIPEASPIHLPPSELTLAQVLRDAGYATGFFGKWHLSGGFDMPHGSPADHGFDHWFATNNNAAPEHNQPTNFVENGKPLGQLDGHSSQLIANAASDWVAAQPADQPVFVVLFPHAPHSPVSASDAFREPYAALGEDQSHYLGTIAETDAALADFDAAMRDTGRSDNTLTFFSSDNGPAASGPPPRHRHHGSAGGLRSAKGSLYEGGIRVPGIIRWPEVVSPGSERDEPVFLEDVFPTFAAAADVAVPTDRTIDGIDLSPMLRGEAMNRADKPTFWIKPWADDPHAAIRIGPWKLLGRNDWQGGLRDLELYQLDDDRSESINLVKQAPTRVREMLALLLDRMSSVEADRPRFEAIRPKVRPLYESASASSTRRHFFPEGAADGKHKATKWQSWNSVGPHWLAIEMARPFAWSGCRIVWGKESARRYRVVLINADRSESVVAEVEDGSSNDDRTLNWPARNASALRLECLEPIGRQGYEVFEIEPIR